MKRIVKGILIIVLVTLAVGTTSVIYWSKHTELEMTKQYGTIVVERTELVDYKVFLNPVGNFTALNQINSITRRKIAEYMKENNYKLVEGTHMFNITIDNFEIYISKDFKFERIDDPK
ncbi:hypothetical protein ACFO9Q_02995 [Paenibacillus sp. GCM10023252]|uniref:hypothetical protein n=1 Tax=Paenibacillus sp. GCM10023252 TaxID=3252649 RepID=UPI003620C698